MWVYETTAHTSVTTTTAATVTTRRASGACAGRSLPGGCRRPAAPLCAARAAGTVAPCRRDGWLAAAASVPECAASSSGRLAAGCRRPCRLTDGGSTRVGRPVATSGRAVDAGACFCGIGSLLAGGSDLLPSPALRAAVPLRQLGAGEAAAGAQPGLPGVRLELGGRQVVQGDRIGQGARIGQVDRCHCRRGIGG